MYKDLISQRKKDFESSFDHAKTESAAIRTGRANVSMVEDIQVEYIGSKLRIKELATISIPEPRVILIQPWDKGALAVIEKGIKDSSLGLNPAVDGQSVRLTIPPLTEERRKEFIKVLHQKMEEVRIRMRQIREDIIRKVQQEVKEKVAREDDLHKAKDEIQKLMDDYNKKIEELVRKKEAELMS